MMNIELGRIIQAEREHEIQAALRVRRLIRPTETTDTARPAAHVPNRLQRPASTGAATR
jgi:hypothetical protein